MFSHAGLCMAATGFLYLFQAPAQENRAPWWLFWLLLGIGVISALIWWFTQSQAGETSAAGVSSAVSTEAEASPPSSTPAETAPVADEAVSQARAESVSAEPVAEEFDETSGAEEPEPPAAIEPEEEPKEVTPAVETTPQKPDNLTRIEGIGPKISGVLQANGITTFNQLASTAVSRLEEILQTDKNLRLANPETWPEQARLAAAGEWERLEALQSQLSAGRREKSK